VGTGCGLAEAEEYLRRCMAAGTASDYVRSLLAEVLYAQGRTEEAIQLQKEYVRKHPNRDSLQLLARFLGRTGRTVKRIGAAGK
jgi:predicted Zn-dependent protease